MFKTVLEKSTNTHVLESVNPVKVTEISNDGTLALELKGQSYVTHGEHGTIVIESDNVIKYIQKELNPVTNSLINAFD